MRLLVDIMISLLPTLVFMCLGISSIIISKLTTASCDEPRQTFVLAYGIISIILGVMWIACPIMVYARRKSTEKIRYEFMIIVLMILTMWYAFAFTIGGGVLLFTYIACNGSNNLYVMNIVIFITSLVAVCLGILATFCIGANM